MENTKYNGWTNYATWRINLEIFDQWELGDFLGYEDIDPKDVDVQALGEDMKDYVQQLIDEQSPSDSITNSYANAFINEVNWQEIAKHMVDAYINYEA
jgi:hypothetical protein